MNITIETKILSALTSNQDYTRKVLPFIEKDYFFDRGEQFVFEEIKNFFNKYNALPTKDILLLAVTENKSIGEKDFISCESVIQSFEPVEDNKEWLISETEKFCKDRAIHNAIRQSIGIIDDKDKVLGKDAIPSLLQNALAVSFDKTIGHDYLTDIEERYEIYHQKENKLPFDLNLFNKITGGGMSSKTLTCVLSVTGGGKSMWLCHHAAHCLSVGKNVLYISMEMSEARLAERIDSNLINIDLNDLKRLSKREYLNKMEPIKHGTKGSLVIKEYPTSSAHAGHFDALIQELKIKKKFVPDVIMVDYLNICASQRYKASGNVNSYTMVKAIAEELRALAVKHDVPVFSASQLNRGGNGNSDPDLTHVSESAGLSHTVDFMFALVATEELEKKGQILVKQLKNRFGDLNYYNKFLVGIRRARMRFYNLEEEESVANIQQQSVIDDDSPFALPSKFKGNYSDISV